MSLNVAALAHRPQSEDCFLTPTHALAVRLKTAIDNVHSVQVLYGDPYWLKPDEDQTVFAYQTAALTKVATGQAHDYWTVSLQAPYSRLQYLFVVEGLDGSVVLYGDRGLRADSKSARLDATNYFRMPYFHQIDAVNTPAWVSETVWYQIFPERFANGDTSNDPVGTKPWQPDDHPGREDHYGGDLQGVLDHLDDLEALGVNGLYFCPVFKASSNHKYDTIDYYQIDPDFGDKALFAKLVEEAHKRDMKVMLDAVFNHLGFASLQWQDVLTNGPASRFVNWFHIHSWPLTPYHDPLLNQGAPQFDTFAFGPGMPKLNTANPEVQDYLLDIATYWIKQFDIDAWRLDVANEVDHHFWRRFHEAATTAKADFYVLGEVWHESRPWLNGTEFTGVMNYAFTQQIEDHFLTGVIDAPELVARLSDQLMLYPDAANQAMLNMLDSHDTPRLLTVAKDNWAKAYQALAFTFVQTGAPCVYYGTEMGITGENDPDDRKPMDWDQLYGDTWQQVAALIHLRRAYAVLFGRGSTRLAVVDGLIQVTRQFDDRVAKAWFNTGMTAKPLAAPATFAQGYKAQVLAPLGFVISIS